MQPKQIYVKRVDTSKPPCYNEGNIFIICNTGSYKETIPDKGGGEGFVRTWVFFN